MADRYLGLEVAVAVQCYHVIIAVYADVSLSADKSASLQSYIVPTLMAR